MRFVSRTNLYSICFLSLALGLLANNSPDAFGAVVWVGGTDSAWTTAANWNPAAVPATGGTQTYRINVGSTGLPANHLTYSTTQGHTVFAAATNDRSLFITQGSMDITGGVFETQTASGAVESDGMGNSATNAAVLTVSGSGAYINNSATKNQFEVVYGVNATGNLKIQAGGSFTANNLLYFGQASGTGTVDLDGGTLSIGQVYKGGTNPANVNANFNFNGGTLQARTGTTTGSTFMTGLTAATVKAGGAKIDTNNLGITIAQNLLDGTGGAGGNGLTVSNSNGSGSGSLTLSGTNTYYGQTTVNTFTTLNLKSAGALGNTSGVTVFSTGMLQLDGGVTVTGKTVNLYGSGSGTSLQANTGANVWAGAVNVGNTAARVGAYAAGSSLTISGTIQNGDGNSIAVRNFSTGVTIFSGANTYTGNTTVVNGTLKISGSDNRLPTGTILHLGYANNTGISGTFDLNGLNQTVAGLVLDGPGSSNGIITNTGSAASTFTVNNTVNSTFAGLITNSSQALNLLKDGNGDLTLSAANTYTGTTRISAGLLAVNNTTGSGTGTGIVTVDTLGALGGSGIVTGLVNASGAVSPGNGIGKLTLAGGLAATNATYNWELGSLLDTAAGIAGTNWDLLDLAGTGALTLTNSTIHLANIAPSADSFWSSTRRWTIVANAASINLGGSLAVTGYDSRFGSFIASSSSDRDLVLSWTPVPEPGAALLMATGLIGLLANAWRRKLCGMVKCQRTDATA